MRDKIQNFGRALSAMVMPNIGAFIAWGLITAMFIPTGWFPNEHLAKLVGPMLTYMLPLLKPTDPRAHPLQQKKPLPSCSNEGPAQPKLSRLIKLFLEDAF